MGILRMGYAHIRVTDLAEAKAHYANTLGLYETLDQDGKLYFKGCLLYTSPSPRDKRQSRMPSSA